MTRRRLSVRDLLTLRRLLALMEWSVPVFLEVSFMADRMDEEAWVETEEEEEEEEEVLGTMYMAISS